MMKLYAHMTDDRMKQPDTNMLYRAPPKSMDDHVFLQFR